MKALDNNIVNALGLIAKVNHDGRYSVLSRKIVYKEECVILRTRCGHLKGVQDVSDFNGNNHGGLIGYVY